MSDQNTIEIMPPTPEIKPASVKEKTRIKEIDQRAERLVEGLNKTIEEAKRPEAFSPPEISSISRPKQEELSAELAPKVTAHVILKAFRETIGRENESWMEGLEKRVSTAKELQEAEDNGALFNWVEEEKYGGPPPGPQRILDKIKWKLSGKAYQDKLVNEHVNLLQNQINEIERELKPVDKQLAFSPEEEAVVKSAQTIIAESKKRVEELTEVSPAPPETFEQLKRVKEEVQKLALEIKEQYLKMFRSSGIYKTLGDEFYAEFDSTSVRYHERREENERKAKALISGEIQAFNQSLVEIQKRFASLADFSKGRILAKQREEIAKFAELYALQGEKYTQQRAEKVETLIDSLWKLSEVLECFDFDLRQRFRRDQKGRVVGVYEESVEGVLRAISEQIEAGIDFRRKGIEVCDSIEEALGESFVEAYESKVVLENQLPEKREFPEGDVYERLIHHYFEDRKERPSNLKIRLFKHNGEVLVGLDYDFNNQIRLLQIMDAVYPGYCNVQHLLFVSKDIGKVFDVTTLIPKSKWRGMEWTLRYMPDETIKPFMERYGRDYPDKKNESFIVYGDLDSPGKIAALFHEFGHQIVTSNSDRKLAQEAQELRTRSMFQLGGASNMPKEKFIRTKKLLVINERRASARGLWLLRALKQKGIDFGVKMREFVKPLDDALRTYERGYPQFYPECGVRFTRK